MKKILLILTITISYSQLFAEETTKDYLSCKQQRDKHKELNKVYLETKNEEVHILAKKSLDASKEPCSNWAKNYSFKY